MKQIYLTSAKRRAYSNNYNNELKSKGICTRCRANHDRGTFQCSACMKRTNEERKVVEALRMKEGNCPRCGSKAMPNRRHCYSCGRQHTIRVNKVKLKRHEQGLCIIGGCKAELVSVYYCEKHLKRQRALQAEHYAKRKGNADGTDQETGRG